MSSLGTLRIWQALTCLNNDQTVIMSAFMSVAAMQLHIMTLCASTNMNDVTIPWVWLCVCCWVDAAADAVSNCCWSTGSKLTNCTLPSWFVCNISRRRVSSITGSHWINSNAFCWTYYSLNSVMGRALATITILVCVICVLKQKILICRHSKNKIFLLELKILVYV